MKAYIIYLVQMGVIMCGEYTWKSFFLGGGGGNVCPTVKHDVGSVMVWGCMAESGVGNLHFIKGIMSNTFV
jgi:hypothetical protein